MFNLVSRRSLLRCTQSTWRSRRSASKTWRRRSRRSGLRSKSAAKRRCRCSLLHLQYFAQCNWTLTSSQHAANKSSFRNCWGSHSLLISVLLLVLGLSANGLDIPGPSWRQLPGLYFGTLASIKSTLTSLVHYADRLEQPGFRAVSTVVLWVDWVQGPPYLVQLAHIWALASVVSTSRYLGL